MEFEHLNLPLEVIQGKVPGSVDRLAKLSVPEQESLGLLLAYTYISFNADHHWELSCWDDTKNRGRELMSEHLLRETKAYLTYLSSLSSNLDNGGLQERHEQFCVHLAKAYQWLEQNGYIAEFDRYFREVVCQSGLS